MDDQMRNRLFARRLYEADADSTWTNCIKTRLCDIGRGFGYQVGASGVAEASRDFGEWLYDVTWLEYSDGLLAGAPLVAECEWGNWDAVVDDFDKLLLARASVRLMIFDGNYKPGSKGIAERLAARIRKFYGPCAEEGWLLAGWERCGPSAGESGEKDWRFRYYRVGANAILL